MSFLWHTALSLCDVGSNVIYYLLGRELVAADIDLLEKVFKHMADKKEIFAKALDQCAFNRLVASEQLWEQTHSADLIYQIKQLKKGKDLLLVTNKENGYNILQAGIVNLLAYSSSLLSGWTEESMESTVDINQECIIKSRIALIRCLLEYGCDPNRGLVRSNKKRHVVRNEMVLTDAPNDELNESTSEHETLLQFDALLNDEVMLSEDNFDDPLVMPVDTPLLLVCCIYNCHNLISLSKQSKRRDPTRVKRNKSNRLSGDSRPSSIADSVLSPLGNCRSEEHDSLKNLPTSNDDELLGEPTAPNKHKLLRRRHTIDTVNDFEKLKQKYGGKCSINSQHELNHQCQLSCERINEEQQHSDKPSENCSGCSGCSSMPVKKQELSCNELSSSSSASIVSSYYADKTFLNNKSSSSNHSASVSNYTDSLDQPKTNVDSVLIDEYFEEDSSDSDMSSSSEEEFDEQEEGQKSLTNIYNYVLDDQNYFDQYEYALDSMCCKLNDTEQNLCSVNPKEYINCANPISVKPGSLCTSLFSLPPSSVKSYLKQSPPMIAELAGKKTPKGSRLRLIYDKLNKQRLELLDLLLKYDADKYLVAALSPQSLKQLNRKSQNMLAKWYARGQDFFRPLSPMMAALCLDDVDIFARLYRHHQNLFYYFRPNEEYELIYYAIRFQAENCLIFLLSQSSEVAPPASNSSPSGSRTYSITDINKNISTMFYIIENTRSPKIINVLLKCGFDLSKRDSITGNTALHCLFNEKNCACNRSALFREAETGAHTCQTRQQRNVLGEFYAPRNLSKILFALLKHGGLKPHVNALNHEDKLSIQVLFEWTELIEAACFVGNQVWQVELEDCVSLLLKSGADLFPVLSGQPVGLANNCVDTLFKTILSICNSADPKRPKKHLDLRFVNHLLQQVLDLDNQCIGLKKRQPRGCCTYRRHADTYSSLIGNYIHILLHSHTEDFESGLKLFKLVCSFEKQLRQLEAASTTRLIDPVLVKRVVYQWIMLPNFLSSSRQFEKNHFIKSMLIHAIGHGLYEPNDCLAYYTENAWTSNNLLNHCVHLVQLCKTAYQLELLHDLIRTLIQYGADPNLDPFDFSALEPSRSYPLMLSSCQIKCSKMKTAAGFVDLFCSHPGLTKSRCILTRLCDLVKVSPMQSGQEVYSKTTQLMFLNRCFNEKSYSINNAGCAAATNAFMSHEKRRPNSPVLLLTPSPSYQSLLVLAGGTSVSSTSNNVVVDSSLLLLKHYKKIVKLLFDSMESSCVEKCLKPDVEQPYFHRSCHNHYSDRQRNYSNYMSVVPRRLNESETLNAYLEQLAASPRSLKSISRQFIRRQLSGNDLVANQICLLPLPRRLKEYLNFIE